MCSCAARVEATVIISCVAKILHLFARISSTEFLKSMVNTEI